VAVELVEQVQTLFLLTVQPEVEEEVELLPAVYVL
jgi:hypothetical protein